MKKPNRPPPRREIFVLTPGEKKAVAFIAVAFLLGLGTMQYCATHPRPPQPPTAKELRHAKRGAGRVSPQSAQTTPVPRRRGARPAVGRETPAREEAD